MIDLVSMGASNVTYGQRAQIKLGRWDTPQLNAGGTKANTSLDFDLQGSDNQTGALNNVMTLKADGTSCKETWSWRWEVTLFCLCRGSSRGRGIPTQMQPRTARSESDSPSRALPR